MADLRMRPRFMLDLDCNAKAVVQVLHDRVEDADPSLDGTFNRQHCMLRISAARRAIWSPELDITFEPRPDGLPGVRLRGLLGPRADIWTGFAFLLAFLIAVAVVGALTGVAQLTLDVPPWGFAATAAAAVAAGAVYAASFIGQGLALAQMYELRSYLDVCVEAAERQARQAPATPLDSARL